MVDAVCSCFLPFASGCRDGRGEGGNPGDGMAGAFSGWGDLSVRVAERYLDGSERGRGGGAGDGASGAGGLPTVFAGREAAGVLLR